MKQDWNKSAKDQPDGQENVKLNDLFGKLTHAYEAASPEDKAAFEERLKKLNEIVFGATTSETSLANEKPQWAERTSGRKVTPVDWIKMHYGCWIDGEWQPNGLTQADISRADRKLYDAYVARTRRLPNESLNIPIQPRRPADPNKTLEMKRKANRDYMRRQSKRDPAI